MRKHLSSMAGATTTQTPSTVHSNYLRAVYMHLSALVFVSFLAIMVHGQGGAFIVTKVADTNDGVCDADCSLREAIAAANSASTDDSIGFDPTFFSEPRVITLSGAELAVVNNGSITVNGPGAGNLTISGANLSRVLNLGDGVVATLNALSIKNGKTESFNNGAGLLNRGNLTLNNSTVEDNDAGEGAGGGIYSEGGEGRVTTLSVNGSSIRGNKGAGAGIYVLMGTASIVGSSFLNNIGTTGSAILNAGADLTLSGVAISNNTAMSGTLFNSGILIAIDTEINNNLATSTGVGGGGVWNDKGSLTMTNSSITGNSTSGDGGGLYSRMGTVTLNNVSISNNTACPHCRGGGIESLIATLDLTDVTISGNTAGAGAGLMMSQGTADVINTAISNNSASSGGGIVVGDGTLNLTNSTITGNTANTGSSGGGGGMAVGSATVNLRSSTIFGNSTTSELGGGGIRHGNGTAIGEINVHNSIIAGNKAENSPAHDISGPIISGGYNLIQNTTGSTIDGVTTGNILGVDAQLLPAKNNGGVTITSALHPTSPAIDAGDPSDSPSTDQRGTERPQDGDLDGLSRPDIGAYERRITIFQVSKTADTNDGNCDADCSLREAVAVTNAAITPDNAIRFDPAVFSTPQVITLSGGQLVIAASGTLLLNGPGVDALAISGGNATRVFLISSQSAVALASITISGGNGMGTFFQGNGGAIMNQEGLLSVKNAVVSGNAVSSSSGLGGGLYNFRGQMRIIDSVVSNNSAQEAGGVYNSNFGGILEVSNSRIIENQTHERGAGIFNLGTANIVACIVNNNTGIGSVYNQDIMSIDRTTIASNIGRGIRNNSSGTINLTSSTVVNNTEGGITSLGPLNVHLSSISNNSTAFGGGGIDSDGPVTITRSTISGNSTAQFGGGIKSSGSLTVTNSTVSGNSAANQTFGGGGIYSEIADEEHFTITNSTIAFNRAPTGGGIFNNVGEARLKNTIVSDNTATNSGPDFQGTLTSQGHNLIEDTSGTLIKGTTIGDVLNVDPNLDRGLRVNGGVTLTHALRPGSPAIDQGSESSPVTPIDQRGTVRPYDFPSLANAEGGDGSDIGAFERQAIDVSGLTMFDYDGDARSDLSVFRPSEGNWYLQQSTAGFYGINFGVDADKIVPADFDGDGRTDIAVFRPSTGLWYITNSSDASISYHVFGIEEDLPTPADYDGDGKADISVFRPSTGTWYRTNSSNGSFSTVQFGQDGDRPTIGDFDGDGKADVAVFRPSTGAWYQLNSLDGSFFGEQFGNATDKIAPADYDGDGKTDIGIYRPSEGLWYYKNSSNGTYTPYVFGLADDIPVAGDYDGDGKADIGVFRPSDGYWYIVNSSNGSFTILPWGQNGDIPTPNAFGN